jgi:hypothetical protein
MHRFLLSLLLLLFLCTCVRAQKSQDLRQDEAFFNQQALVYQKWLDKAGLGQYFKLRELDVQEKRLDLYLEFRSDSLELIINQWTTVKERFERTSGLTLEQQLFYKATSLMEVRQGIMSVQLYDTYDLRKTPLFSRAIYFEDGKVKTETSDPKSKIDKINLSPSMISGGKTVSAADFRKEYEKAFVFGCIANFAKERFGRDVCLDRNPEVRILEDQEVLRFEVLDLCKEVLKDENSTICGWLNAFGYDCNWAKRELLTFTVTHENTVDGIRITVELDGKIGSGFYANVSRGGYVSMEVDRDTELENYADELAIEIRKMLEKCQN